MPIQPTYPGVYIQEVSSGVRTITGVATSVAAFFGRTAKGPINKAVNCPDYTTFLRKFGGADPRSDLANSVKQFYDNGGGECYVVRIAHNPTKASIVLKDLTGAENVLRVSAKDEGVWGNNLRLEIDYNTTNPDETFNLRVIQDENGLISASENHVNLSMNPNSPRYVVNFVTQSSNLIDVQAIANTLTLAAGYSESRRVFDGIDVTKPADLTTLAKALNTLIYTPPAGVQAASKFEISVDDGAFLPIDLSNTTKLGETPADLTALNLDINGKFASQLPTGVTVNVEAWVVDATTKTVVLRITSTTASKQSVRIRAASTNDFAAPFMFGVDVGSPGTELEFAL